MTNKEIILAERPTGMPDKHTFSFVESELPFIGNGDY